VFGSVLFRFISVLFSDVLFSVFSFQLSVSSFLLLVWRVEDKENLPNNWHTHTARNGNFSKAIA